jgi:hypothetical protein
MKGKKGFWMLMLACIGVAGQVFAQDDIELKRQAKIDLGLSGLGISYELPLAKKFLLEGAAGLGTGYDMHNDMAATLNLAAPSAFFTLHGKYYYNRAKRLEKGKNLDFNSGTFVGLKVKYATPNLWNDDDGSSYVYFGPNRNSDTFLAAVHWGFQYKIGKHFAYEFYVGLGYATSYVTYYYLYSRWDNTLYLDANIRFSYLLPF